MKLRHSSITEFIQNPVQDNTQSVLATLWGFAQCEGRRIAITHELDLSPLLPRQRARLCLYHDDFIVVVFPCLSVRVLTFDNTPLLGFYDDTDDSVIRHSFDATPETTLWTLLAVVDYVTLTTQPFTKPFLLETISKYGPLLEEFNTVQYKKQATAIGAFYITGHSYFQYESPTQFKYNGHLLDSPYQGSIQRWLKYVSDGGGIHDNPPNIEGYEAFIDFCVEGLFKRNAITHHIRVSRTRPDPTLKDYIYMPWINVSPGYPMNTNYTVRPITAGKNNRIEEWHYLDTPSVNPDLRVILNDSRQTEDLVPLLIQTTSRRIVPLYHFDPFKGVASLQYGLENGSSYPVKIIHKDQVFLLDVRGLLQIYESLTPQEQRLALKYLCPFDINQFWQFYGAKTTYQVLEETGDFTYLQRWLGILEDNRIERS